MSSSDIAACRKLLRGGSRTFYMASFLLPRSVRESASALYAFCRLADDAVDVEGGSLAAIAELRGRLDLAYSGRPLSRPIDRAFAETISRYGIPRELPEGLITGLEWDAVSRRYDTLEDLEAYAVRVAGTVGAMMALLMGTTSPELIARACDLGVAMQLTNIARDVGEDARMGRLYLPASWLNEAGIDTEAWLAKPSFSPELECVIARLLETADTFYERADPAIHQLPISCRPGIRAARLLYAEIGHELRRTGFDSVSSRAVVPTRRKLELCGTALGALQSRPKYLSSGNVREARFIVEAVASAAFDGGAARLPSWWDIRGRTLRLLDILEQIERRDLAARHSEAPSELIA
ncbi:phytoene/squalene synthase family protein [Hyphomicrobium sp. ghe19]|uniref:phytoene/squalene synthase family protein n=1 Tax=Hyphomicrobium sp. ghe19 TaxID=2682968 RepID=UPI0013675259|nr:15-cis-phytoene synthase [Hyphomicrobium sp. ghe19]